MAAQGHADLATPLRGLPTPVNIPGVGRIEVGPLPTARQAANDYTQSAGIDYHPPTDYVKVVPERATRIAQAYDDMKHDPQNPQVKAAYQAMIDETIAQWKQIEQTGLDIDWIDLPTTGDPYAASPRLATEDVRKNNHLWVFPTTAGFGSDAAFDASDNPLLQDTGIVIKGHKLVANDVFRIVHDYFGHIKEGNGFRADGEENAWRSHSAMYSPLARWAMTTETRGQNSWVNYGPYGESNRSASSEKTHYADQKIGLLPEWAMREGSGQPDDFEVMRPRMQEHVDLLSARYDMPPIEVKPMGHSDDYAVAYAGMNDIMVNPPQFTPENLAKRAKEWDGLAVDPSEQGTLTHEYGHVLMKHLREKHGREVVDAIVIKHAGVPEYNYDRFPVSSDRSPSAYGMENPAEYEAESFAAFNSGTVAWSDNPAFPPDPDDPGASYRRSLETAQALWEELLALGGLQ